MGGVSIRSVVLATLALAVLGTSIAGFAIYTRVQGTSNARGLVRQSNRRIELVEDAQTATVAQIGNIMALLIAPGPGSSGRPEDAHGQALAALAELEALARGDPQRAAELDALTVQYRETSTLLDSALTHVRTGDLIATVRFMNETRLGERLAKLLDNFAVVLQGEHELLGAAQRREAEGYDQLTGLLSVTVVGWLGLLAVLGYVMFRAVVGPLDAVGRVAERIASGDLDQRAPVAGPRELARLSRSVNHMAEVLIRRSSEINAYLAQDLETRTAQLEESNGHLEQQVAERRRAEEALREREQRLGLILNSTPDLIAFMDNAGTLVFANSAFGRILGFRPDQVLGRPAIDLVHPEDSPAGPNATAELTRMLLKGAQTLRILSAAGAPRVMEVEGHYIFDNVERPSGMVLVARDVTDKHRAEAEIEQRRRAEKQLQQQLAHQAYHDPLTNLPNRARFREQLEHLLRDPARGGELISLLFIDLDDFKSINDSLGHHAGDQALLGVTDRVSGSIPPTAIAARLGGDEFAVLLHHSQDRDAMAIGDAILAAMRAPVVVANHEIYVRSSIGISQGRVSGMTATELLRRADVAMYAAKARGKGRYALYESSMDDTMAERLALVNDIQRALDRDEFTVYYQPIVEIATLRPVGVEALVRWQHPRLGLLNPGRFVPVAEEAGFIRQIGEWTLRESCRQAKAWLERYGGDHRLSMAVNVSAKQIYEPDFLSIVRNALADADLPPSRLTLEITETTMLQDADSAAEKLSDLRRLGVRVALDDFGTGYSSLSYLRRMPIDIVKVDKSFIDGITRDSRDQEVARSIVSLAQKLTLEIVAEGIETADQVEWLRQLGCGLGQGFYFSPPRPPEEIAVILTQTTPRPPGAERAA